ncbi:response regulator transcription factor [Azospirillum sp. RWY-5-1]|uniref:Response regulator transcription factor n=1 Tax=Azospirillum oleiclasticum TaxID=2735135 RepID=A0ABX2TJ87_9PROT|nr:response regulator transcription factor [Azospirillum oleiclasticum]NYZ14420.1 response regulator transcription factor [Azospirillum oleiclasticum]NYZ23228.1 response regulator transcription factor [Azospirillum oleiclasticum]
MRILIAEDDPLHRAFLRTTLERLLPAGADILEAADGMVAEALARDGTLDAAVLDLQMPRLSGAEVARAIWRRRPATRILFWSNYADEAYVRGVSKIVPSAAVYGYVLKSASEDRIRFALRGVLIEEQCVIDREIWGVHHRANDRRQGLTEFEYEALVDIALGLTDRAIGQRRNLSIRGVQSRLHGLYDKLGIHGQGDGEDAGAGPFNPRSRAVFAGFARGLLNTDGLEREDARLAAWLKERGHRSD